jgi:4-amino-4-deoxy-L-arabinose transferase-like glycosyltransferase
MWILGVVIVLAYMCLLGGYNLGEPDEPRYAEIAREMLELHDWVTPHLNYVKYFEKPPLVYWLTAINFQLFGVSEGVARLWPAVFGLIGIMMAYQLGRSMYDTWTGHAAAALLATSPLYFGLSQILILDMPLTALMTIALGAFWFAYRGASYRRPFVLLLYAATGLAVLTKGPVAALLNGGIIFVFLLLRREWTALRWLLSPVGMLLFFLIVLPWFVLVSRQNPEFLDFFIFNQHLKRFLNPNEHQQGLWFFFPIVWGGMLPWSAFAVFAPRRWRQFAQQLLTRRVSAATLFCVLWSGVVFTFFSLSGSKLATYVLPMFCPMAILAARFFQWVIGASQVQVLRRGYVALLVFAVVAVLAGIVTGMVIDDPKVGVILPRVYIGTSIIIAALCAALVLIRRQAYQSSLVTLMVAMLAVQLVAISGREVVEKYPVLGKAIHQQARPEDQIIVYNHYVQGIPFYAGRRVVMVGGHGELDFGSHQGDQSAFFWEKDESLIEAWQSPRHIFLVINRRELDPLLSRLHPAPRQIAADGKKVLIVNFAE